MSDEPEPELSAAERAKRRRRLERDFGDVLPEQTSDDESDPSERRTDRDPTDEWYRRQVPPHHGG